VSLEFLNTHKELPPTSKTGPRSMPLDSETLTRFPQMVQEPIPTGMSTSGCPFPSEEEPHNTMSILLKTPTHGSQELPSVRTFGATLHKALSPTSGNLTPKPETSDGVDNGTMINWPNSMLEAMSKFQSQSLTLEMTKWSILSNTTIVG